LLLNSLCIAASTSNQALEIIDQDQGGLVYRYLE
jgi:hypothetical protein